MMDKGKYQVNNQERVQGFVIGDNNDIHLHFDNSAETSPAIVPIYPERPNSSNINRVDGSQKSHNSEAETPNLPLGTCYIIYEQHSSNVQRIQWAPDGKRTASAGDDTMVRIWDSATGLPLLTYRGHQRRLSVVNALSWSPDGCRIVSSARNDPVHVWDAAIGTTILRYQGHAVPVIGAITDDIFALAWEPKGTRIASSSTQILSMHNHGDIHIWDADTGKNLLVYHAHNNIVSIVAWSPDSIYVASADSTGTVQIWNSYTGHQLLTYQPRHKRKLFDKVVSALIWSPDGTKIASAYYDCRDVYVWDAKTGGTLLVYSGHTALVRCLAWSPDGTRIASASYDKTVHLWDAATGERFFIYREHTDNVEAIAWSPDGTRIASGSRDRTVHVWQAV